MNHLPGFAWMKDLKGRYVYANSALQTLKEYRDGYIGLTDAELLPQDIADISRANDQKVIAERKPLEILEPYLVDGEKHFFLVSKFPIFDKSGALIMIGGSSIDISAQARTEERLREYERAVEGVEEMIAVVDRDYRYLVANQAFLNHRGLSREQVVGSFVWDLLSKETFTQLVKPRLDQAFAGTVVRYEMQHRYPTLGLREIFVSYFPIEGAHGVDRVTCVLQDITERKAASNALNEAERHYREIFENAGEGIFQSTPAGRYIAANPAL
ncbi:MAG TPA: PAS domain-containing protein, partial [Pyrinomonadaceae bacterium]|nr:PAS domain-containing protein [Pyrinomonadaceae bacterium]